MCHALIIEDDFLAADYMDALACLGGATSSVIAQTEEQAVLAARARRPDIIVSDVRLGEGCGRSAVRRIVAKAGDVPTLFVTGHPDECDAETSTAIIPKPFMRDGFLEAFRRNAPLQQASI